MKNLICDVCRQKVPNPVSGNNYFHIAHRDLCEPCHDLLQLKVKPVIRTKRPFNYQWFDNLLQNTIEDAIEKGKFNVS